MHVDIVVYNLEPCRTKVPTSGSIGNGEVESLLIEYLLYVHVPLNNLASKYVDAGSFQLSQVHSNVQFPTTDHSLPTSYTSPSTAIRLLDRDLATMLAWRSVYEFASMSPLRSAACSSAMAALRTSEFPRLRMRVRGGFPL